uniref:Ion transport domain-containing protein n=1 Tax=Eptatretus burgeri TaxID=7764 RepID=A0A8C4QLW6_EPTBU
METYHNIRSKGALVTLWSIMMVNNWHVFMEAYSRHVSKWSEVYFVSWWFISSVVCVNLFIVFIIESFIGKYDLLNSSPSSQLQEENHLFTFEGMFRHAVKEPTDEELRASLSQNPHIRKSCENLQSKFELSTTF